LSGRETWPGGAVAPQPRPQRPTAVRVRRYDADGVIQTFEIADLDISHSHIASLPDDEVLVVGARCRWEGERTKPNAAIYSATGRLLRAGVLGDGVGDVATTEAGAIWIGYFDEGIYGNFGWGTRRGGSEPIGRSGLARFATDFERVWEFPRNRQLSISDTPWLTLDGETVWSTFYTDYPVARVEDDAVRTWSDAAGRGGGLLVDGDRVARLLGGDTVLGGLEGAEFVATGTVQLELPGRVGRRPPTHVRQGSVLHVIEPNGTWSITDLASLEAAVEPV
jgi:hypothetical protein